MHCLHIVNHSELDFYCLLCGTQILSSTGGDLNVCEHLLYARLNEEPEPWHNKIFEEDESWDPDDLDLEGVAKEKELSLIIFSDGMLYFSFLFDFCEST